MGKGWWLVASLVVIACIAILISIELANPKDECNVLPKPSQIAECITQKSLEQGNPNLCGKRLKDPVFADECLKAHAFSTKNLSLCESMQGSNSRGYCQFMFAAESTDPILCNMSFSPYWQDNCFFNLSLALGDPVLCKHVDRFAFEDQCHDKLSFKLDDFEQCVYIRNATTMNQCLRKHALDKNETVM